MFNNIKFVIKIKKEIRCYYFIDENCYLKYFILFLGGLLGMLGRDRELDGVCGFMSMIFIGMESNYLVLVFWEVVDKVSMFFVFVFIRYNN